MLELRIAAVSSGGADPLSAENQRQARSLTDQIAIAMQASQLLQHGNSKVAECFIMSRLRPSTFISGAGLNIGSTVVYSKSNSQSIIEENTPV